MSMRKEGFLNRRNSEACFACVLLWLPLSSAAGPEQFLFVGSLRF